MKLNKCLFAVLLAVLMAMFSCSEESTLTASIMPESHAANDSEIKLTVKIVPQVTRTVRPEIAKYTVELQITEGGQDGYKTVISRTLNARNTSTTFTNISIRDYQVIVSGYDEKGNKILEGISLIDKVSFGNGNPFSEVVVEDYFDVKGVGSIVFKLYGLSSLWDEKLSSCKMILAQANKSTGGNGSSSGGSVGTNSKDVTTDLTMKDSVLTGTIDKISVGSYIITAESNLGINLVQDPLVNIYAGAATEINWMFNIKPDATDDVQLKNTKIPVWNVLPSSNNNNDASSDTVGYISADALFAKPTFISGAGPFVSSANDSSGNLWILSGTTSNLKIQCAGEDTSYILNNITDDIKDFTITDIDGTKNFLFVSKDTLYNYKKKAGTNNFNGVHSMALNGIDGTNSPTFTAVTAVTASGSDIYVAATSTAENTSTTAVNIYKGSVAGENLQAIELSELSIDSDQTVGVNLVETFGENLPNTFKVTDMYFADNSLYITVGTAYFSKNGSNYSYGGLFKYTADSDGNFTLSQKVTNGSVLPDYSETLSIPRCIVPVGDKLYIVDSGFCQAENAGGEQQQGNNEPPTKCNRVCVFNKDSFILGEKADFESTDLHDSIKFDFDCIMNVFNSVDENGSYSF